MTNANSTDAERLDRIGCVIIGLAVVVASLFSVGVWFVHGMNAYVAIAKKNATMSELNVLATDLKRYEKSQGTYPTSAQGLNALMTYLPDLTVGGPWGSVGDRKRPGAPFDLASAGPDGVFDTRDDISLGDDWYKNHGH